MGIFRLVIDQEGANLYFSITSLKKAREKSQGISIMFSTCFETCFETF